MNNLELKHALEKLRDEKADKCASTYQRINKHTSAYRSHSDGYIEGFDANMEIILGLVEALSSIASVHKPSQNTEEYWQQITHESCATVLATDTTIARATLQKLYDRVGK